MAVIIIFNTNVDDHGQTIWHNGRTLYLRSLGCQFDFHLSKFAVYVIFNHSCAILLAIAEHLVFAWKSCIFLSRIP